MEKTFTISVEQAKKWITQLSAVALRAPVLAFPVWVIAAMGFVTQQIDGKKLEITVRVVDE
jgi:hypothetical protein